VLNEHGEEKETRCWRLCERDWIKLMQSFSQSLKTKKVEETMERKNQRKFVSLGLFLASSANHFF